MISGSFTLFSLSSNINCFLKVEQNGTIRSISKRNSNHLIFFVHILEHEDDNVRSDCKKKNRNVEVLSILLRL